MRVLAAFSLFLVATAARAQSLSVLPVNVFLSPGQSATTVTVTNSGQSDTAIQIRAYGWSQKDGTDQLGKSDELLLSPPLAKIPAGASQVIRLVLRQKPQNQEATYRILIDQIPPPSEPGVVHFVLRLSIPVFALPPVRCVPDVQFRLESNDGQFYLVATNAGKMHEAVREMQLTGEDGREVKLESNPLSYVLPGATRRWHIVAPDSSSPKIEALRLKARMNAGVIDQQVRIVAVR